MPVYLELQGIEPEDLKDDEDDHYTDWEALAHLAYGAYHPDEMHDMSAMRDQLDHLDIEGVAAVMNGDMHERMTGRRPDYADEGAE